MSDNLAPDCALPRCHAPAAVTTSVGFDQHGICEKHADSIWRSVEWRDAKRRDEQIPGMEGREYDRADARKVRAERSRKPNSMGQIYFAMTDGLIKVGWTGKLADRMHRMPPNTVLLANYPGTRADETTLHRQLDPCRARGREWYSDGPIIRDFIAKAIEKHGPPRFAQLGWTKPKETVAGKRAGRRP